MECIFLAHIMVQIGLELHLGIDHLHNALLPFFVDTSHPACYIVIRLETSVLTGYAHPPYPHIILDIPSIFLPLAVLQPLLLLPHEFSLHFARLLKMCNFRLHLDWSGDNCMYLWL